VLRLREQKISSVSYADSGTIIHHVLEKFLKKVRLPDGSVERPSDEEIIKEVDAIISEYVYGINCPLPSSMIYSFSRLRDLSLVMVRSVLDEFQRSSFKIVAFEKRISDRRDGALKPMEIKIGDEDGAPVVSLGGVIDRIDIYDDGENKHLRVVDYKTGSHKYDVTKVSTGEDLQLPAYLFTASQKQNSEFFGGETEIHPVSALFLSAEEEKGEINPVRSGFILGDKDILSAASADMDKKILAGISITKKGEISGKAAVSNEQIKDINDSLHSSIVGTARSMYSGKAPRTPSKEACAFCSVRSSCPSAYKDKH
jgi:ATP-dependent helicase/nuclease subunit B